MSDEHLQQKLVPLTYITNFLRHLPTLKFVAIMTTNVPLHTYYDAIFAFYGARKQLTCLWMFH